MCNFAHCGGLRYFVARQFLSQIYALLSVKFSGLKICECKKNDKYQVWCTIARASDTGVLRAQQKMHNTTVVERDLNDYASNDDDSDDDDTHLP